MEYEQIEQRLLKKAIQENNINAICNIELAWGTVLGMIIMYHNDILSLSKIDEIIEMIDNQVGFSCDFSTKEMWDEYKRNCINDD
jgi:hypothetical protein